MTQELTTSVLKQAVAGNAAAFRLSLRLEAISPKVFPPTYEGGEYADEVRRIGGEDVPCVLLDSVASQANRMELALQDSLDAGEIQLPIVAVDFRAIENPGIPRITSLQAPHRIADAILRDSTIVDGKTPTKFRQSTIGKQLDLLSNAHATPLLTYAPHCLVFGLWDSTGPRGGLGVKFARAIVSEIIGVHAKRGVKTASRIDPLNIRVNSGRLYRAKDGGWTLDEKEAAKEKGKPALLGKDGKPSEANHGNVTPSIDEGGYTIDYAEQTTVLSLPALRRLRFPIQHGKKSSAELDLAARTYLASLGLLGATLAIDCGYDLRSRCLLRATDRVVWQLLGKPGDEPQQFELDRSAAIGIYQESLAAVKELGIPLETNEIILTPNDELVTLVKKSIELAVASGSEEG